MPTKFIKDEILVNQIEILRILKLYDLNDCITTCKFMECVIRAFEANGNTKIDLPIIAMELIASFDVKKKKRQEKVYRLYGHDMEGEKHLLLIKID